jgi:hypothetical protein
MRAAILLIAAGVLLGSCKKGKDDPFLSLKFRNKRIQQEWVLKNMSYLYMNESNGNTYITEETYDGTTLTRVYTENGFSFTGAYKVQFVLDIRKGGIYSYTLSDDNNSESLETLWHWVDTDKKKSSIWLTDFPYSYLDEPILIDRLSSKELVLSGDYLNDQGTFKTTVRLKMEFERKK